jgi:hypothetical protein
LSGGPGSPPHRARVQEPDPLARTVAGRLPGRRDRAVPTEPSGGPTRDVCGAPHFSRWNGAVSETALRQGLCSSRPRPPPDDDAACHVGARAASTWAVRSERPGLPRSGVNPRHASSTSDRRREKNDGFHRHSSQDFLGEAAEQDPANSTESGRVARPAQAHRRTSIAGSTPRAWKETDDAGSRSSLGANYHAESKRLPVPRGAIERGSSHGNA